LRDVLTWGYFVRYIPAEIDFCGDELSILDEMQFAVPERLPRVGANLIDDEGAVRILQLVDVLDSSYSLVVGPTDLE
jgi:hypothetical protein